MNEEKTKLCKKCNETKFLSEFYIIKSGVQLGKNHTYCKKCCNLNSRDWHASNLEKSRLRHVRRYYDMTPEEYKALPKECAICYCKEDLQIDHDHITGKIRDILCGNCNRGVGNFKDSPNLLIRATDYILKHYDQGPL